MAERLGLDADRIRVAARLHDVGMATVSDAIALKPGPLTDDERRELRAHAQVGYAMLAGSGVELLDTAADVASTHHERWDGRGYPRGLAGEEIPIAGRIAAVADAFDAMTTDRAYRPAGSVEDAVATLRAERGRQFDPAVVDAFLDRLDDVLDILERFAPSPEERPEPQDGTQVTLQAAATALAISPSRLRRWADEGRIPAIRTAGGHRRFPLEAVRRLAAERGVRPQVRPVDPPTTPLTQLAEQIRAHGPRFVAAAAAAVYREGPPGWFASESAAGDLREWLRELAAACQTGRYAGAVQASEALMRRAHLHAATLLERHTFMERFGQIALRALARGGAGSTELAAARRLFTALQQSLLDVRD